MRDDIVKLIYEKERGGSRSKSLKTGKKLDPRIDYDDDFDWGPKRISIARRKEYGWDCKSLNYNLRPLYRFLDQSVGRPWNDVHSEIHSQIDPRTANGHTIYKCMDHHVDSHGNGVVSWRRYGGGLYVDDDGILCKTEYHPRQRPEVPVTSLHWYDNIWFQLHTFKTKAKCGCVHFKEPVHPEDADKPRWYRPYRNEPAVCIHGNEPLTREIWYVVEYVYHKPDEIYMVHKLEDYRQPGGGLRRGYEKWGLSESYPVHYVYYRDVPEKMKDPIEKLTKRRTANRKHLKLIRKALEKAAGQKAA
jgi:hypothetical protein